MKNSSRKNTWFRALSITSFLAAVVLLAGTTRASANIPFKLRGESLQEIVAKNQACMTCHDDYQYTQLFPFSVHGSLSCTSCHQGVSDVEKHMTGEVRMPQPECKGCHGTIVSEFLGSFHYLQENFICSDCHTDIHAAVPDRDNIKKRTILLCTRCHSMEDYSRSGHSAAIMDKDNNDSASCADCHGLHDIMTLHTNAEKFPAQAREFYNRTCIKCHSDEQMMTRNNLPTKTVEQYLHSYHGKVESLGYPTRVAGCADCHTSHNILKKEDPASTVNPENLITNCGRCHKGATPGFVKFRPHADYRDPRKYPVLFATFLFMSMLLLGTLAFFWFHTGLWWRKAYWEKYKEDRYGPAWERPYSPDKGRRMVRRFNDEKRYLHMVLVVSFLTLAMTGTPLRYAHKPWARIMMGLFGGAHSAGLIHRTAAAVLIVVFMYVVVKMIYYLFRDYGSDRTLWKKRLFGPDSLMPNRKDWEDMKGMFRWFMNRGEKPRFGRWTYWEKFDFLAVFWGMFAIGGSGLILWKPGFASHFVPGWMFNVAIIIHSDEALLAIAFIFTVHFFNTHFIPTSFPMNKTVFLGAEKMDEMYDHRPLEYERLIEEGRLEKEVVQYPSIFRQMLWTIFGWVALLLGIFIAGLVFWGQFLN